MAILLDLGKEKTAWTQTTFVSYKVEWIVNESRGHGPDWLMIDGLLLARLEDVIIIIDIVMD